MNSPGLVLLMMLGSVPTAGTAERDMPPSESAFQSRHRETLDLPYRPNVLPGESPRTSPGGVVQFGQFQSVQVNVDANGMNILGDAANEPSIAIDPTNPNRIVIGWRQFDSVQSNFRQAGWGYSHDAGQTWTFPGVIEPGVFRSDPVLAANADGVVYFYSYNGAYCTMFRSHDGGVTWDSGTYAFGGDKAWMTIDTTNGPGRGNIYAFWSPFYSCCDGSFTRSTDGGDTYMTPIQYSDDSFASLWGTLTVAHDGTLYSISTYGLVGKSANAQDAGVAPTFELSAAPVGGPGIIEGPNPGGLAGQPWIATDHSNGPTGGNVYALGEGFTGSTSLDLGFTRSADDGQTWSTPVRPNDDRIGNGAWHWFASMSVAPNGRIDATWNDTRNSLGSYRLSQVYYSYSIDGGQTWSKNVPLTPVWDSHIGWPQQNKIGDYYHMISDNEGANLAYAATFNGEQDVYFLRILRDCNSNATPDEEDLANELSADCNHNHFPDECESDCNENQKPDDCDIVSGTSADCNANGIPDECESDCNENQNLDDCDIVSGTSADCNANGIPDECEIDQNSVAPGGPFFCAANCAADCNSNGLIDSCDVDSCPVGTAACHDCNQNGIPDGCDLADGTSPDTDQNGVPDECQRCTQIVSGTYPKCAHDARQPHDINSAALPQGIDQFEITFESGCFAHTVDDSFYYVEVEPAFIPAPTVVQVTATENKLVVQLDRPIPKDAWTCFSGFPYCLGFYPGNVDGSTLRNFSDTMQLVSTLNGQQVRPFQETDTNRSGEFTAEDLLRHVDLLNGAGAFTPLYLDILPQCPVVP